MKVEVSQLSYRITMRRRRDDGSLETATLNCTLEEANVRKGDETTSLTEDELSMLILHTELQVNGVMLEMPAPTVRMWVSELN